jgi:hypothetical protein
MKEGAFPLSYLSIPPVDSDPNPNTALHPRRMAVANLLLAPFLLAFLLIYFFMRNAERLYHQPSAAGARRWSPLAAWRLREFNELPHYTAHRYGARARGRAAGGASCVRSHPQCCCMLGQRAPCGALPVSARAPAF